MLLQERPQVGYPVQDFEPHLGEPRTEQDRIVIIAGSALGTPGTMDGIIIHTVGRLPVAVERRQIGELETT